MLRATVVPRDARVNAKGRTISFAASEELDLNSYALMVDVPCIITIEPMPTPADDVMVDDGAIEDTLFEVE